MLRTLEGHVVRGSCAYTCRHVTQITSHATLILTPLPIACAADCLCPLPLPIAFAAHCLCCWFRMLEATEVDAGGGPAPRTSTTERGFAPQGMLHQVPSTRVGQQQAGQQPMDMPLAPLVRGWEMMLHQHLLGTCVGLAQTVNIRSTFVLFCAKFSKYTGYIYGCGQPCTCGRGFTVTAGTRALMQLIMHVCAHTHTHTHTHTYT